MNSLKPLLRDMIAGSFYATGLINPSRKARGKLTTVTFHRVLPDALRKQYPYPGLCVTPKELRWFCAFFKTYFTVGSHTTIYKRWLSGEQPEKPFLSITFDDGQLDNLQYGLPVLKEFDFKATFYIPVASIDEANILWHDRIGYCAVAARSQGQAVMQQILDLAGEYGLPVQTTKAFEEYLAEGAKLISAEKRLQLAQAIEAKLKSEPPSWGRVMSWNEVREVRQQGHEIGSHSMTHTLMPQCNDAQLAFEIGESKRKLEAELDTEMMSYCYPNGDFDERSIEVAEELAYHNAVTTLWGKVDQGDSAYSLKRCDVNTFNNQNRHQQLSASRYALRLSGLQPGV